MGNQVANDIEHYSENKEYALLRWVVSSKCTDEFRERNANARLEIIIPRSG